MNKFVLLTDSASESPYGVLVVNRTSVKAISLSDDARAWQDWVNLNSLSKNEALNGLSHGIFVSDETVGSPTNKNYLRNKLGDAAYQEVSYALNSNDLVLTEALPGFGRRYSIPSLPTKTESILSQPLTTCSEESRQNVVEYKGLVYKHEVGRKEIINTLTKARAIWDPDIAPRGGWRCPAGTQYGGYITDRFGRGCGVGLIRRVGRALVNAGRGVDRLGAARDERRLERVAEQAQRGGGARERVQRGAAQGLRGVARALEGAAQRLLPEPNQTGGGRRTRRNIPETISTERIGEINDRLQGISVELTQLADQPPSKEVEDRIRELQNESSSLRNERDSVPSQPSRMRTPEIAPVSTRRTPGTTRRTGSAPVRRNITARQRDTLDALIVRQRATATRKPTNFTDEQVERILDVFDPDRKLTNSEIDDLLKRVARQDAEDAREGRQIARPWNLVGRGEVLPQIGPPGDIADNAILFSDQEDNRYRKLNDESLTEQLVLNAPKPLSQSTPEAEEAKRVEREEIFREMAARRMPIPDSYAQEFAELVFGAQPRRRRGQARRRRRREAIAQALERGARRVLRAEERPRANREEELQNRIDELQRRRERNLENSVRTERVVGELRNINDELVVRNRQLQKERQRRQRIEAQQPQTPDRPDQTPEEVIDEEPTAVPDTEPADEITPPITTAELRNVRNRFPKFGMPRRAYWRKASKDNETAKEMERRFGRYYDDNNDLNPRGQRINDILFNERNKGPKQPSEPSAPPSRREQSRSIDETTRPTAAARSIDSIERTRPIDATNIGYSEEVELRNRARDEYLKFAERWNKRIGRSPAWNRVNDAVTSFLMRSTPEAQALLKRVDAGGDLRDEFLALQHLEAMAGRANDDAGYWDDFNMLPLYVRNGILKQANIRGLWNGDRTRSPRPEIPMQWLKRTIDGKTVEFDDIFFAHNDAASAIELAKRRAEDGLPQVVFSTNWVSLVSGRAYTTWHRGTLADFEKYLDAIGEDELARDVFGDVRVYDFPMTSPAWASEGDDRPGEPTLRRFLEAARANRHLVRTDRPGSERFGYFGSGGRLYNLDGSRLLDELSDDELRDELNQINDVLNRLKVINRDLAYVADTDGRGRLVGETPPNGALNEFLLEELEQQYRNHIRRREQAAKVRAYVAPRKLFDTLEEAEKKASALAIANRRYKVMHDVLADKYLVLPEDDARGADEFKQRPASYVKDIEELQRFGVLQIVGRFPRNSVAFSPKDARILEFINPNNLAVRKVLPDNDESRFDRQVNWGRLYPLFRRLHDAAQLAEGTEQRLKRQELERQILGNPDRLLADAFWNLPQTDHVRFYDNLAGIVSIMNDLDGRVKQGPDDWSIDTRLREEARAKLKDIRDEIQRLKASTDVYEAMSGHAMEAYFNGFGFPPELFFDAETEDIMQRFSKVSRLGDFNSDVRRDLVNHPAFLPAYQQLMPEDMTITEEVNGIYVSELGVRYKGLLNTLALNLAFAANVDAPVSDRARAFAQAVVNKKRLDAIKARIDRIPPDLLPEYKLPSDVLTNLTPVQRSALDALTPSPRRTSSLMRAMESLEEMRSSGPRWIANFNRALLSSDEDGRTSDTADDYVSQLSSQYDKFYDGITEDLVTPEEFKNWARNFAGMAMALANSRPIKDREQALYEMQWLRAFHAKAGEFGIDIVPIIPANEIGAQRLKGNVNIPQLLDYFFDAMSPKEKSFVVEDMDALGARLAQGVPFPKTFEEARALGREAQFIRDLMFALADEADNPRASSAQRHQFVAIAGALNQMLETIKSRLDMATPEIAEDARRSENRVKRATGTLSRLRNHMVYDRIMGAIDDVFWAQIEDEYKALLKEQTFPFDYYQDVRRNIIEGQQKLMRDALADGVSDSERARALAEATIKSGRLRALDNAYLQAVQGNEINTPLDDVQQMRLDAVIAQSEAFKSDIEEGRAVIRQVVQNYAQEVGMGQKPIREALQTDNVLRLQKLLAKLASQNRRHALQIAQGLEQLNKLDGNGRVEDLDSNDTAVVKLMQRNLGKVRAIQELQAIGLQRLAELTDGRLKPLVQRDDDNADFIPQTIRPNMRPRRLALSRFRDPELAKRHIKEGGDLADIPDEVLIPAMLDGLKYSLSGGSSAWWRGNDGNLYDEDGNRIDEETDLDLFFRFGMAQNVAENERFILTNIKDDRFPDREIKRREQDEEPLRLWQVIRVEDKVTGDVWFLKTSTYGHDDALLEAIGGAAGEELEIGLRRNDIRLGPVVGRAKNEADDPDFDEMWGDDPEYWTKGGEQEGRWFLVRHLGQADHGPSVPSYEDQRTNNQPGGQWRDLEPGALLGLGMDSDQIGENIDLTDLGRVIAMDVALNNEDRNPGNIQFLVQPDGKIRLAPIDHGLIGGGRGAHAEMGPMSPENYLRDKADRVLRPDGKIADVGWDIVDILEHANIRIKGANKEFLRQQIQASLARLQNRLDIIFDVGRLQENGVVLTPAELAHLHAVRQHAEQVLANALATPAFIDSIIDRLSS